MSRLSGRAIKNRLAIVAGLTAAIAGAWLLMRGPSVDLIDELTLEAKVVDVIHRAGTSPAATNGMGIVLVELPDGGRARVFAPLAKAAVGTKMRLKVKRYSDGSRHVSPAIEAPGD